jgi:thiol-disulfide isomerase/thioredoxin
MEKKYDRDLKFVVKAFVAAFVIMLGLHVLNFFIQTPDPKADAVKETMHAIKPIRASEVRGRLVAASGKPVMLVVYASWCGTCRKVMPELQALADQGALAGFEPLFLSLDYQFEKLAKYIEEGEFGPMIGTPYLIKQSAFNTLQGALWPTGGHYSGAIPYIAFLDRQGMAVAEIQGGAKREDLFKALKKARQ